MHEMSLCENIREIIEERASADGFSRVQKVWLEVGPLSCVEPDALRFGFDVVMRGSVAEGAALDIATTPATGQCPACGTTTEIAQRFAPCPSCCMGPMAVVSGDQLKISKLEVV